MLFSFTRASYYVKITRILELSLSRALSRAKTLGLTWPLADRMTEEELAQKLYPSPSSPVVPDWKEVQSTLNGSRYLTRRQIWKEYKEEPPDGDQYSYACELYRICRKVAEKSVMHLTHRADERLHVNYAGKRPEFLHLVTGAVFKA